MTETPHAITDPESWSQGERTLREWLRHTMPAGQAWADLDAIKTEVYARGIADAHRQGPAVPEVDRDVFVDELALHLTETLDLMGVEDADLSDGRVLADTVYCLGYRAAPLARPGDLPPERLIDIAEREALIDPVVALLKEHGFVLNRSDAGRVLDLVWNAGWRPGKVPR